MVIGHSHAMRDPLYSMVVVDPRAVPRAKSGRNFAIGAGYLFIFFAPTGHGLFFFCPRAPIGFPAGQKHPNPIIKPDY